MKKMSLYILSLIGLISITQSVNALEMDYPVSSDTTNISGQDTVQNPIIHINPVELEAKIADSIFILDVRTPEEFQNGKIAHALNENVNDENFKSHVDSLNRETPIYVYCRSGVRSMKAAGILKELGFKKIYNLEGGYLNWLKHVEEPKPDQN